MGFMRNFTRGARQAGIGFFQGATAALPAAAENWNKNKATKRQENRQDTLTAFNVALQNDDVPTMDRMVAANTALAPTFNSLRDSRRAGLMNTAQDAEARITSLRAQMVDPYISREAFAPLDIEYSKLQAELEQTTNRIKAYGGAPSLTPAAPGAAPSTGMAPRPPVAPPAALGGLGGAAAPSSGITLPAGSPAPIGLAPSTAAPGDFRRLAQERFQRQEIAKQTIEFIRTGQADFSPVDVQAAFDTIYPNPDVGKAWMQGVLEAGKAAKEARQAELSARRAAEALSAAQRLNVQLTGQMMRSSMIKDVYNNPAAASIEMQEAHGITPKMVEFYIANEAELKQADAGTMAILTPKYIAHVYGPNADPNRTDGFIQHYKSMAYASVTDLRMDLIRATEDSRNKALNETPESADVINKNYDKRIGEIELQYKRKGTSDDLDKQFRVVAQIPDVKAQVADLKRRALLLAPGTESSFWVTASNIFPAEVVAEAKAPPPAEDWSLLGWMAQRAGAETVTEMARRKAAEPGFSWPAAETMSRRYQQGAQQPAPAGR